MERKLTSIKDAKVSGVTLILSLSISSTLSIMIRGGERSDGVPLRDAAAQSSRMVSLRTLDLSRAILKTFSTQENKPYRSSVRVDHLQMDSLGE